jgi:hypothetical protein
MLGPHPGPVPPPPSLSFRLTGYDPLGHVVRFALICFNSWISSIKPSRGSAHIMPPSLLNWITGLHSELPEQQTHTESSQNSRLTQRPNTDLRPALASLLDRTPDHPKGETKWECRCHTNMSSSRSGSGDPQVGWVKAVRSRHHVSLRGPLDVVGSITSEQEGITLEGEFTVGGRMEAYRSIRITGDVDCV